MDRASLMLWGVCIVFVLVVVNAFFVAAEYALLAACSSCFLCCGNGRLIA
jgi:CBS domain containing-hemolysin-like protein